MRLPSRYGAATIRRVFKTASARFGSDVGGATAIEYGFMASLIVIASVAAMVSLGSSVSSLYGRIATATGSSLR